METVIEQHERRHAPIELVRMSVEQRAYIRALASLEIVEIAVQRAMKEPVTLMAEREDGLLCAVNEIIDRALFGCELTGRWYGAGDIG